MKKAIVSSNTINSNSGILKPNFHLNYGKKRIGAAQKNGCPFLPLGEVTKKVFTGGIFKRIFISNPEYGIPYISAQHMMNLNPLDVSKIISKKYTPRQEDMTLRHNQILLSCAGTVGNVRLIGNELDGIIGSQDIIRIIADNSKMLYGYLFAYLSTPTAYNYIQSYIYGSVVPRIEPNTISKLPVPIISREKQVKIHELIKEASHLRTEANNTFSKLINEINTLLEIEIERKNIKYSFRKIRDIKMFEKRLDASYNCGPGRRIYDVISKQDHITLKDISEIFHPMLFGKKQLKGSENGNFLFKSSSMMKMKPETDFVLSLRKVDLYSKLQVKEGWSLISRTGTVGNVVRINKTLADIYIDDHMIRVKPNENYSGLIFIYLKSFYGQKLIEFQKYGSVQEVINSDYIERIPIPKFLLEEKLIMRFNKEVKEASSKIDKAALNEFNSNELIEKEIESWQK
ncbi:methylation-associated defense system restriction endonuclease subunit S MAD5 [Fluviicola taffensis]|uniref:Restriction modification system DNA specificity domain protein n=1 Tax=Fluviicola taffensis (strain DSM 16823 / NCIMB 13979 / RW262) TaxID=755732 RepID=F2IJ66_FLUTR|nr:restriction endonuclease subunit S [Fluviicola taffensis]AEA44936.1 restriction modification system DNA specificity domain protein [Fluviicola taffensis DSM 16823]